MTTSPLIWIVVLVAVGLLPFISVMLTSFVKMAVVLSIIRSAVGAPQVPPNSVVTGLALILSMVVMAPVASEVAEKFKRGEKVFYYGSLKEISRAFNRAVKPIERFLIRNTNQKHINKFSQTLGSSGVNNKIDWKILILAFVISQLEEAFQMGFVIFLPFLVVDMLIGSILLSLGMHMLSPTAVSLPFKLLLFVFADGWTLVGTSLIGTYR